MKHKHNYAPALGLGENPDGSARWWTCECKRRIRFDPRPIDPAAAHVIADIKGTGLRSVRPTDYDAWKRMTFTEGD